MKFKTKLVAVNVILLVFLCVTSVMMYRATTALIENTGWVVHTSLVIANANALGKAMVDMETGQRGFMLTGNEEFLEPFISGKRAFALTVESTLDLVDDNLSQVKRLKKIQQLKVNWLKTAGEYEIDLRRKIDLGQLPKKALTHVLQGNTIDGLPQPEGSQSGKDIMDEIRGVLKDFINVEKTLMETRNVESEATGEEAKNITLFGAILALLLGGGATIFMRGKLMGQLGADPLALMAMSQNVAGGMLTSRVELEEAATSMNSNVATSLNHMAETLQQNIETLQEQTEALKSSQEQLTDFQHQIEGINKSQSVIQFHPDGRIISANAIFLDAMGYMAEEIENQHHRMFVQEAERSAASYQAFWRDLAAGIEQRGEFVRVHKDGQMVWLQATYTPIKDPSGVVFKIVKYATNVTEQKLRNADFEGQIRGINKSQSVIQFHPDGRIIAANAIFLDVMGYMAEEVENQHHRMFVQEAERSVSSYQAFWRDLAAGTEQRGEFARVRKDGQMVWLQATYTPIKDPSGVVFKIVKYATNVTEQKILTDSYQDQITMLSRGEYSTEFSPQGDQDEIGRALLDLTITLGQVTTVAESIVQGDYSAKVEVKGPQDVLGTSINLMSQNLIETRDMTRREDWLKEGQALLGNTLRGEVTLEEMTDKCLSTLASYVDAQAGVFYVGEQDSEELRLCSTYAFDRRKRLDSTIVLGQGIVGQAAKEKKAFILEEVPDDHISIDTGLGSSPPRSLMVVPIVYQGLVNGVLELASLKPFSDDQKELLDRICENLAIAINSTQNRERLATTLDKSQAQAKALQRQQEEMEAQNEELQGQTDALRNSEMELQVQSEELRATNEELMEKGETLTKQKLKIEQNSLRVEQSMRDVEQKSRELEQASKYKSEFLANMSHELRTPLNSLLILAKVLTDNEEGNLTDEQIESARVIHSGGKDLLHLINDILDLSKVEAGKLTVNIETVSLDDVCSRMHSLAAPLATEKGNTWAIDLIKGLPSVLTTDQQRLEQILKNLLSNAFKFTSQGSVSLRIHRMEEGTTLHHANLQADSTIVFSVVDTGMGIPAEKQSAIFEAFQQVDGSTSRTHGGTGLGLTITRELASLLGGEIQLVSEAGKGSTFSLVLPCEYVEGGSAPTSVSPSSMAQPSVNVLQNEPSSESSAQYTQTGEEVNLSPSDVRGNNCLLIIEDDPVFGGILQQYGVKEGYVCSWAQTGEEGLRLALTVQPSAILMDMTLPDLSGESILESLKHNPATRYIPVHVISGRDNLEGTLTKGAVGFLTKPVDGDVLRETIRSISQSQGKPLPNVLLVEDDPIVQQATRQMIEQQGGAHIEVVDTVQGAMDYLRDSPCDLLITDLRLPDRSGLDLLKELTQQEEGALPPAIVYTAKDLTREEHQELLNYAACVVLKGGMAPERLLDEVGGFFQSLQRPDSAPFAATLPAPHDVEPLTDPSFLEGQTVLVVDDDIRNVFALSKVLKQSGASVVIADMGALALEKLEVEPKVDLVLLDIMMPEMDGYETTRRIRQHPIYSEVPIVILSAKTMPDEEAKCLEAGANGYLSKPLDLHLLHRMMKQHLYHPIEGRV